MQKTPWDLYDGFWVGVCIIKVINNDTQWLEDLFSCLKRHSPIVERKNRMPLKKTKPQSGPMGKVIKDEDFYYLTQEGNKHEKGKKMRSRLANQTNFKSTWQKCDFNLSIFSLLISLEILFFKLRKEALLLNKHI